MNTEKPKTSANPGILFSDEEFLQYIELREAEKHPMRTKEQMAYYIVWLLRHEKAGSAYAVLLDKRNRFLGSVKIKDHHCWLAQMFPLLEDMRDKLGAESYFVGHNHVDKPMIPSYEDYDITAAMKNWKGMTFKGHFITDGNLDYKEIE
ncbi:MAG: hypothetical protein E7658_02615 [Ruminococcaceae bacterium]|nr:hypothetical protein [Oscillospiraceae bacterium]